MLKRLTLLLFLFLSIFSVSAQVVDIATGFNAPVGVALYGNTLYVSEYNADRVSKIDITQPNPTIVPVFNIANPTGLLVVANTLYVNSETNSKTYKVDLTQGTPTPVEFVAGLPSAEGLLLNGTDLYISYKNGGGGIKKVNINDPTTLTNVISNCPAGGMVIKNNELFFGESIGGSRVKKFNLTTPNPTPTVVLENLVGPNGLTLNGNFVYVSEAGAGGQRIVRFDVTQSVPVVETVVSGLSSPSLAVFDGLDMYFSQESNGKVSKLVLNTPVFNGLTYCTGSNNANLGGASPTGGTYSGPNVTNNGNGETFTFTGGVGTYTVTYTLSNGATVTASLTAVNPASVSVTAPAPVNLSAGVQMGWTGGTPMGGIYSGQGITDNGNGISYTFNPAAAGIGTHQLTYSYSDANGCKVSATATITVLPDLPANNACSGGTDITQLFGGLTVVNTSSQYNNTGYTSTGDPAVDLGSCYYPGDPFQHTIWFTFTGTGDKYRIRAVSCNSSNYNNDTQVAIFSGNCANPVFVACNDDQEPGTNILNFSVEVQTQAGVQYRMLVDGYGGSEGQFCLEVANLSAPCPNDLVFTTQAEVDAFTVNYPSCSNVSGNVTIGFSGIGNITSLAPLSNITSIGGSLKLFNNSVLTNLNGLQNLTAVGGDLWLDSNSKLTDVSGLSSLQTVGGVFYVISSDDLTNLNGMTNLNSAAILSLQNNNKLSSIAGLAGFAPTTGLTVNNNKELINLTGLESMTAVAGNVQIESNAKLTSLEGLNNLTQTGGDLNIQVNLTLANLNGLSNLKTVGGKFWIAGQSLLANLNPLSNLTSIGNGLVLIQNNGITNLNGLQNLVTCNGAMNIEQNAALTTLNGMQNVLPAGITGLRIVDNPVLSVCDVESICNYLATASNQAFITGNAAGCETRAQVESACLVSVKDLKVASISLYPNPTQGVVQLSNVQAEIVQVYNNIGKMVYMSKTPGNSIDISQVPAGVYLIKITTKNQIFAAKVIKD